MNEAQFKKHLASLVHGHHHPEEHDWEQAPAAGSPPPKAAKKKTKVKPAARKSRKQ